MKRSSCTALVDIALIAIAAGLATTGAPARQPELSGTLNLLCTPHILWCAGMKTEFQRIYPMVTVEFVRLPSGDALTRLRNERANPQFDIWWGGPIDSFIAAKQ
jgi:iron(III) transport system substrate-binding protein